jgi:hypothetical protein
MPYFLTVTTEEHTYMHLVVYCLATKYMEEDITFGRVHALISVPIRLKNVHNG